MNNTQFPADEKKHPPYWARYKTVTTQLFTSSDPATIPAVAEAIRRSELIILPTDTVYGVGASAFDDEAIRCLFFVKMMWFTTISLKIGPCTISRFLNLRTES